MSPEGAIQKSKIVMVCFAPAGAPFYTDPYRGFAALAPGYFPSPLRGCKKYAAFAVTAAKPSYNRCLGQGDVAAGESRPTHC